MSETKLTAAAAASSGKNIVFFNKLRVNKVTKNVTIYVTSHKRQETSISEGILKGFTMRTQGDAVVNGQLNMIDPDTGKSLKSDHPIVKQLQTLQRGDELPGFIINTDAPVIDLSTGEELRNLYWVEAV